MERMVEEADEYMLSILKGMDGCFQQYSLSEFKEHLNADNLSSKEEVDGWVFWNESESEINEIIKHVLEEIVSLLKSHAVSYLVQFWAPEEDGDQVYLITSDQPFALKGLRKGYCLYREQCVNYGRCSTQTGPVGRAYQSKLPESSPDLLLYSTKEFPLRDHAARCRLRGYLALPIFDLHNKQHCYGVMEFLCFFPTIHTFKLQLTKLRSTHVSLVPVRATPVPQSVIEIGQIVRRAKKVVPQLYLAQVWVPCKQCCDSSTHNLSCMEITYTIIADIVGIDSEYKYLHQYLDAYKYHNIRQVNLRNKKSSFCRNICDFSISAENPVAHYAQLARLSSRYEIFLESVHNSDELYVVDFFLHQYNNKYSREDGLFVCLLSRIMEREPKSIKLSSEGQLVDEEIINQLSEEIFMLDEIERYAGEFSLADFTKYLPKNDLFSGEKNRLGGLFWRRNSFMDDKVNSNSSVEEKITHFMSRISLDKCCGLVQFWAPKDEDSRHYLTTVDQPFFVGNSLQKGLAYWRKHSMENDYCVDEGAKEEQLGPPGRVFRSGNPEFTNDLRLYSTTEFPSRNHAACWGLREYFVLPVFDINGQHEKCIGVLEFLGLGYEFFNFFTPIRKALKELNLCFDIQASHRQIHIEIENALELIIGIPRVHMVDVWTTCTRCGSEKDISLSCMEQAHCRAGDWSFYMEIRKFSHMHTRKGITRMVLASDNKSFFFRNSRHFSIFEHPLAHVMQKNRIGGYFAICLQSKDTENLVYILELFLNQGPASHILSFWNYLMPIMRKNLKSFIIASGQQFTDELAIEVPVFPEEDELNLSELNSQQDSFPIKFKFVPYGQKENHHSGDQQAHILHDNTDDVTSTSNAKCFSSKNKGEKKKTGRIHLTIEDLKPHFGKRLKVVEEVLGVGRSTIKRACREYGIDRWPCNEKHIKNLSIFEVERADKHSQKNTCIDHQNLPQASTESTSYLAVQPEADTVMIKAKYEDDTVKFQVRLSSGMDKLVEEVASRLKLEIGSFKLKYMDEDNDEILLTGDADLQLCAKSMTALGKTFIQLIVGLTRK